MVKEAFTRLAFPPRWHFDVLRALDHFRAAGRPVDARLDDALEVVRRRQRKGGRWNQQSRYTGRVHFRLEPGQPSRWNTLRALRVLRWAGA